MIREAMRSKDMVAIGRVVLTNRKRPIALEPLGKGLRAVTLRYPYEVRKAEEYFEDIQDIKVLGEMLKLAEHILETKKGDFDPSAFEDRYERAVAEMLRRKRAGLPARSAAPVSSPSNVISLIDALRRSVKTERKRSARR